MREVYRKHGLTVRFEADRLITVLEAGEAVEEGGRFFCEPLAAPHPPSDPELTMAMQERVQSAVAAIRGAVPAPLSIERLLVSEGHAAHEFGDVTWEEASRRVHISIVRGEHRALVDLGDFDVDHVARVAEAMLAMTSGTHRGGIRLHPAVSAALLPHLEGVAPPNIALMQSGGGRDGKGQLIGEWTVDGTSPPNWYRPSYRVRPQRVPLNVRAVCAVTDIDETLPVAVALLAPPRGLTMRVLVAAGGQSYPAAIHLTRIEAIARETTWYPYAAGAFGAGMAVL